MGLCDQLKIIRFKIFSCTIELGSQNVLTFLNGSISRVFRKYLGGVLNGWLEYPNLLLDVLFAAGITFLERSYRESSVPL